MSISIAIYSDYTGGVFVFSQRLALSLRKNGFYVCMIMPSPSNHDQISVCNFFASDGIDIFYVDLDCNCGELRFADFLNTKQFDFLLLNYRRVIYSLVASKCNFVRTKIISVCHNDHGSYYDLISYYSSMVSVFLCPSQKTYKILSRLLSNRKADIHYVPHGIPLDKNVLKSNYVNIPLTLTYHGRLDEEQKKLSYLFQISLLLKNYGVDFSLKIIGDGKDIESYKKFVLLHNLSSNVFFYGHLDWPILKEHLMDSHISVLTSQYEGFCYGLAEAMSLYLAPVVFETKGVVEEYVQDGQNGFVVPFGDVQAFVEKIVLLNEDRNLLLTFQNLSHEIISTRYSMDLWLQRLSFILNFYKDKISRKWPLYLPCDMNSRFSFLRRFV